MLCHIFLPDVKLMDKEKCSTPSTQQSFLRQRKRLTEAGNTVLYALLKGNNVHYVQALATSPETVRSLQAASLLSLTAQTAYYANYQHNDAPTVSKERGPACLSPTR